MFSSERLLDDRELRAAVVALDAADAALGGSSEVAYNRARVLVLEGSHGEALEMLARAVELGWHDAAVASWDPDLQPIRSRPEFESLLGLMLQRRDGEPTEGRTTSEFRWERPESKGLRVASLGSIDSWTLLLGRTDGALHVIDPSTGVTLLDTSDPARQGDPVVRACCSPDGLGAAIIYASNLVALIRRTSAESARFETLHVLSPAEEVSRAAWSSDGGSVLCWSSSDHYHSTYFVGSDPVPGLVFDRGGELTLRIPDVVDADASPVAQLFAVVSHERLYLLDQNAILRDIQVDMECRAVAISRDGARVAVGGTDDALWIGPVSEHGGPVLRCDPNGPAPFGYFDSGINRLDWSADGRWIAGVAGKGCVPIVIESATGRLHWCPGVLTTWMSVVFEPYVSHRSQFFYFGPADLRCIDLSSVARIPALEPAILELDVALDEVRGAADYLDHASEPRSVIIGNDCLASVNGREAAVNWTRFELPGGGYLVRTRSGYVTGQLSGVVTRKWGFNSRAGLRPTLLCYFSPRRCVAEAHGVEVLPPLLERQWR